MTIKLQLFAASKDQIHYFKQLVQRVNLPVACTSYKTLWKLSFFGESPRQALIEQVELLVRRKKNATAGKNKSRFYWSVFRFFNRIKSNILYRQYQAWLRSIDADYIGIWNGKKFRQAILVLAAKAQSKKLVYFERGPLPGYSCLDPNGVNAHSSIPRDENFYRARSINIKAERPVETIAEKDVLPKDYIFVPFQVVEDSNIYLHSPWIHNMRHLYQALEAAVKSNSGLHFVIKPHPACSERYEDLFEKNNNISFVNKIDSRVLVDNAHAVLTVNSTVGIEALMAHKKVLVLGDALYAFNPLVQTITNQTELNQVLANLDNWSPDVMLIEQFVDYLAHDYAIPGDAMKSPDMTHWKVLEQKLSLILQGKANQAIGLKKGS